MMYRQAKRAGNEMAQWGLMAEIEELEKEIAEAHASIDGKMTVGKDGHLVVHVGNIISPIVPHWRSVEQEELASAE